MPDRNYEDQKFFVPHLVEDPKVTSSQTQDSFRRREHLRVWRAGVTCESIDSACDPQPLTVIDLRERAFG